MRFTEAVASCFKKYATSAGRASRSEYWNWVLFLFLAQIIAKSLDIIVFNAPVDKGLVLENINREYLDTHPISAIMIVVLIWPWLAVAIRRLHDINRSAWWIFVSAIPIGGTIVLLIWNCTIGTQGENQYGPDPLTS